MFGKWLIIDVSTNTESKSFVSDDNPHYQINFSKDSINDKTNLNLNVSSTLLGSLPLAMEYLIKYPYGCMEQTTSSLVPVIIALENPKYFSDALKDKNAKAMVETGIERLVKFQGSDGGWSWWSW